MFATPTFAGNQLYTGDAFTVPPGRFQFQLFYNSTFGGAYRVSGTALTYGATSNVDVRLNNGHLWNNEGPDVKLGPNVGFKWRFVGNGLTTPSVAVSALYAINTGVSSQPHKNDWGALLIGQYPAGYFTLLGNFGRVFVGDPTPDLYYYGFALVRVASPRTLYAVEYSDLRRVGNTANGAATQVALGAVLGPRRQLSYSIQFAYLPNGQTVHYHMTVGVSKYF